MLRRPPLGRARSADQPLSWAHRRGDCPRPRQPVRPLPPVDRADPGAPHAARRARRHAGRHMHRETQPRDNGGQWRRRAGRLRKERGGASRVAQLEAIERRKQRSFRSSLLRRPPAESCSGSGRPLRPLPARVQTPLGSQSTSEPDRQIPPLVLTRRTRARCSGSGIPRPGQKSQMRPVRVPARREPKSKPLQRSDCS